MKITIAIILSILFCSCSIDKIEFNEKYLEGMWVNNYSFEKGTEDSLIVKVIFNFKATGKIEYDLKSESEDKWEIKKSPERLCLFSKGREVQYQVEVISISEFNLSLSYKGRTRIYNFTR